MPKTPPRPKGSSTASGILAMCLLLVGIAAGGSSAATSADDLPGSAQAVTAWIAADDWIRTGALPQSGSENARVPLGDVEAISLMLRLDGRVVATGEADGGDDEMLRRATGRLLSACAANLEARWPEEMHEELRRMALLEVELAGPARPLPGSTFARAAASVDPGLDTMAVRRGDRWARAFPGRLLAAGLAGDPATTLGRLATETGLPRGASLRELLGLDSVGLYRLPTIRLGQLESGGVPAILVGLDPSGMPGRVDRAAVRELAAGLLEHLQRRLHPDALRVAEDVAEDATDRIDGPSGLGLRGDHDPISGRHEPFVAPPLPQAIAVLSAVRLASADAALAPEATSLARRLLIDLSEVDPIETPPFDRLDALAAITIAAELAPTLAEDDEDAAALVALARDSVEDAMREEVFETLSPGLQAIVVAAAATRARPGPEASSEPSRDADETARRLQDAWARTDEAARVGLLPWFAWAATRLPDAGGLATELSAFRTRLLQLQIGAASDEDSPGAAVAEDRLGGFDLEQGPRPRADARSVLPALGLALMLADAQVTPRDGEAAQLDALRSTVASQGLALRFLQRSIVSPEAASRLPHGTFAAGGVRDAPWDPRQSTMVQALALWWLAECLASGLP